MTAPPTAAELVAHLPTLCTVDEAAAVARTSTRNVRRWIRSGRLTAVRLVPGGSSRVLVPRSSIESLLASAMGAA